jgi:hypothetical protein
MVVVRGTRWRWRRRWRVRGRPRAMEDRRRQWLKQGGVARRRGALAAATSGSRSLKSAVVARVLTVKEMEEDGGTTF